MLWSNSLNPWNYFPAHESFARSLFLQRSSSSRSDQVVQRLSTTMKTVAKGILKDHQIPVASSTTCSGNLKGFNNAGYKATFRPLKVQVPLTESTLFTPMKCMRRLQRDAILIIGMCGLIMFVGQACSTWHWVIFWDSWNENQLKSNKEYGDSLYAILALMRTDQEKARYIFLEDVQQPGRLLEQNSIVENRRSEWYNETTIRWRTSKDDDKKVEMMRGYPLSLVFWMTQRGDNSAWSSDWAKEWLPSVQNSSTTTPMDRKLYNKVRLPQAAP
jgi:hypothetical protein